MSVVVIGGGLSGLAAAASLARAGRDVTVLEAEAELGGLASSFERAGRRYPLGYHHILESDTALWQRLEQLGLAERVVWAKHRMAFWIGGSAHELTSPRGLLRFPLRRRTKLGLIALGLRTFVSEPDPAQDGRSWLEGIGGSAACLDFLDRVVALRFGHSTAELSASYLRRRISTRELSATLGTIPGANWTHLLIEASRRELEDLGVRVLTGIAAAGLERDGERVEAVRLADGGRLPADAVVSSVHPHAFLAIAPGLGAPIFEGVRSSSLLSLVVAVRPPVPTTHYWNNLLEPAHAAGVVFQLDRLEASLAPPGLHVLNLVTHGHADTDTAWWGRDRARILEDSLDALQAATGVRPEPVWSHLTRFPFYTPFYHPGYRPPPVRCPGATNLYFAGNYTTFPQVATTGMAMRSGERAAAALLEDPA